MCSGHCAGAGDGAESRPTPVPSWSIHSNGGDVLIKNTHEINAKEKNKLD